MSGVAYLQEDTPAYSLFSPRARKFFEPDIWTHVALTYDGARIHLYVDGQQVNPRSPRRRSRQPPTGRSGSVAAKLRYLRGQQLRRPIDEVRLYGRALLCQAELAADMDAPIQTPKPGPSPPTPSTKAKATTHRRDATGNGHTATTKAGPGAGQVRRRASNSTAKADCCVTSPTPGLQLAKNSRSRPGCGRKGGCSTIR